MKRLHRRSPLLPTLSTFQEFSLVISELESRSADSAPRLECIEILDIVPDRSPDYRVDQMFKPKFGAGLGFPQSSTARRACICYLLEPVNHELLGQNSTAYNRNVRDIALRAKYA